MLPSSRLSSKLGGETSLKSYLLQRIHCRGAHVETTSQLLAELFGDQFDFALLYVIIIVARVTLSRV